MADVTASIITIGDELLIGQTIDTNSAWIGQELNKIGIWIKRRVAVGDVREEILSALAEEAERNHLVIITGGLGPTNDDITKPVLCEFFGCSLEVNEGARQNVIDIFTKLKREITDTNLRQAEVPASCTVFQNKRGTAPGMWFEKEGVIFISLPGVPHEMKGLMTDMLELIAQKFELPVVLHRTLLTAGQGESVISDLLQDFEKQLPSTIKLAYLPSYGMVRLRLTARGADEKSLTQQLDENFLRLQKEVKEWLVADEDISLSESISRMLRRKKLTLGSAESCTGGFIAHLITSCPGSTDVYQGSVVAYSNQSKQDILGVNAATIEKYGAVSEQTVREMATGALNRLQSDYVIATSGIMGPGGGSEEKPVGTVWICVAGKHGIKAQKRFFRFDRMRNIGLTAHAALNMLRLMVLEEYPD